MNRVAWRVGLVHRDVMPAAKDAVPRRWELDWELVTREAADWDDGATPYLDVFLRRHGPQWTIDDLGVLLRRLEDAGYGWLRADGVRARLDRRNPGTWTR